MLRVDDLFCAGGAGEVVVGDPAQCGGQFRSRLAGRGGVRGVQAHQVVQPVPVLADLAEEVGVEEFVERALGLFAEGGGRRGAAELRARVHAQQPVEPGGAGWQSAVRDVEAGPYVVVVSGDRQRRQPGALLRERALHRGEPASRPGGQPGADHAYRQWQPGA